MAKNMTSVTKTVYLLTAWWLVNHTLLACECVVSSFYTRTLICHVQDGFHKNAKSTKLWVISRWPHQYFTCSLSRKKQNNVEKSVYLKRKNLTAHQKSISSSKSSFAGTNQVASLIMGDNLFEFWTSNCSSASDQWLFCHAPSMRFTP